MPAEAREDDHQYSDQQPKAPVEEMAEPSEENLIVKDDPVSPNGPSPTHGPVKDQENLSQDNPLPDATQLEALVREVLTPATVGSLTKKLIRQAVAEKLGLGETAVNEIRPILSNIVEKLIQEFNEAEQSPIPKRNAKKRRTPAAVQAAAHSDSDHPSESAGDESDDEPKSSTRSRPVGMRKAQSDAMTKASFLAHAQTYKSNLGPIEFDLIPREYATGSCGWFFGSKKEFEVDGKTLMCQLTVNCTVLGSKSWKKGKPQSDELNSAASAPAEETPLS